MRKFLLATLLAGGCFFGSQQQSHACPTCLTTAAQVQTVATPWGPLLLFLAPVSVMTNALIIQLTQCRQMALQEAWLSATLPGLGILFNLQMNQCTQLANRIQRLR